MSPASGTGGAKLERVGLGPPTTWSGLRSVARTLAKSGVKRPIVMPGGSQGAETTSYCLIAFLASNSASVLDAEGVRLDSPATVQALRFLRSLVEDGYMPADVVPTNGIARRRCSPRARWRSASAAATRLQASLPQRWEIRLSSSGITSASSPCRPGRAAHPSCAAGTMIYGIFSQTAQPRVALDLLKQAVDPDALAGIARSTGRIPARRSAVRIAEADFTFLSQTAEMLERAVTRPATPSYARVSAQPQAMLEAVLTGRLGPAPAATRTARDDRRDHGLTRIA